MGVGIRGDNDGIEPAVVLRDKLLEILSRHDIVGLTSIGCPDDEYMQEARILHAKIAYKYSEVFNELDPGKSLETIMGILQYIFELQFDEDYEDDELIFMAYEIFKLKC